MKSLQQQVKQLEADLKCFEGSPMLVSIGDNYTLVQGTSLADSVIVPTMDDKCVGG